MCSKLINHKPALFIYFTAFISTIFCKTFYYLLKKLLGRFQDFLSLSTSTDLCGFNLELHLQLNTFPFLCHLKILFLYPPNLEVKERGMFVFETSHLPIFSKLCILQHITMHWWERKSCTCFYINRFCSWLAAIAFLVNRDILCGVCANDLEYIYKFFWRDMGPLMAQFPDLRDLPQ